VNKKKGCLVGDAHVKKKMPKAKREWSRNFTAEKTHCQRPARTDGYGKCNSDEFSVR
jgi:hypothetical protein